VFFSDPLQVIVARMVAGIGAAAIMPATLSLLTAAYPADERTKAVGIWAGVCGGGSVVGFLGTGLLLHHWSWQAIFWALAGCAAIAFVFGLTIGSSRDETAAPVDWWGALLIGSAIAVFVLGVIEAPTRGWTDPVVYLCVLAGATLSVLFVIVELRRKHPLLDVRLFAKPDFATGAIGVTLLYFAMYAYFFLAMQHIQLVLGYTPLQTAAAISPLAVPMLVLGALNHWYLPRVGLRVAASVGLAIMGVGLLCMRQIPLDATYLELAWPILVVAVGMGFCSAPVTSAITGAVPDEKQGVASAVNDSTREIGAALGIAVAGSMLAAYYSRTLAPQITDLPEQIRRAASDSLAQALAIAPQLGPQGDTLAAQAKAAFMESMNSSLIALAVVLFVAATFVAVWAPGRDGQQIRFVRPRSPGRHRSP
jgi:MFS family permease